MLSEKINKYEESSDIARALRDIKGHLSRFNYLSEACKGITVKVLTGSPLEVTVKELRPVLDKVEYLYPLSSDMQRIIKSFNNLVKNLSTVYISHLAVNTVEMENTINNFYKVLKKLHNTVTSSGYNDFSWFLHIGSSISVDMESIETAIGKLAQYDRALAKKLTNVKSIYLELENLVLAYHAKAYTACNK